MRDGFIDTVKGEDESLSLHVDLCSQRYQQLISKLDGLDVRLTRLEEYIIEIREKLNDVNKDASKTYLKWAGAIITIMAGIIVKLALG